MSDTKLDPASLTSEERAIVDAEASILRRLKFPPIGNLYEHAFVNVKPVLIQRRALFAPAKEEKFLPCGCVRCTCENEIQCQGCGVKLCETHRKTMLAAPAPPAEMPGSIQPLLKLAKDRYNIVLCSGVSGLDTATAWRLAIEAAERFVSKMQQKADENAPPVTPPLAMSEELERVFDAAKARAGWHLDRGQMQQFDEIDADIASVRAQATAPKVVKMEKVAYTRDLLSLMRWQIDNDEGDNELDRHSQAIDAALAELDAVEGRKP